MEEIWKDINGFIGYQISNLGNIRSFWLRKGAYGKHILCESPKMRKPHAHRTGHSTISLRRDGKSFEFYVHRLVLEHFVGPCPDNMECCHNDGNSRNNQVNNLRWDTCKENFRDRKKHGNYPEGINHWHAKINTENVLDIRNRLINKEPKIDIAALYGVSICTINDIEKRRSWKHI